eukprot:CAMPEP_0174710394 /NCGR_PEP_ID=MMETSP1094-20130205/12048_1 /TAXON_ID=156173 /ORGANISM="Chrysochromulina brevifilum, Strain UTEX LB 985" /LENGTH=88 /DNA_ID=CAMNT_0015909199 /DNA_START=186 /DNA_END=454 /DNA_ORIENTATION=-
MSQSPRVASRAAPSPTHLDKTRTVESFSSLDAADTAAAKGSRMGVDYGFATALHLTVISARLRPGDCLHERGMEAEWYMGTVNAFVDT